MELNVGAPRLQRGEFKVVGDAEVGYADERFGGAARGSLFYFDQQNASGWSETMRGGGSGELWFVSGKGRDALRFEVLASGGGLNYSTDTYRGNAFTSQDTWMGRGVLFVGLRLRPSATLRAQGLVGGGAQWESYNFLSSDPALLAIEDTEKLTFRSEARWMTHWAFLPEVLSVRLQAGGSWFSLARTSDSYLSDARNFATTASRVRQLELSGRLSFEIDAAAFVGLLPFVYGGVDHLSMSSDAGSNSLTVPSAGVGITKPVW